MKRRIRKLRLLILLLMVQPLVCAQFTHAQSTPAQPDTIRYVRTTDNGGSYKNDGKSWVNAKDDVQEAINDLASYLTNLKLSDPNTKITTGSVYVAAGTYTPTESTESSTDGILYTSFKIPEGISVYGGFAGTETGPGAREMSNGKTFADNNSNVLANDHVFPWDFKNITILSGDHNNSADYESFLTRTDEKSQYNESFPGSSFHVVWFATNGFIEGSQSRAAKLNLPARVDGFTITGGYASNTTISERVHNSFGGGVYMVEGAELRNCIVSNNAAARRGGGVYCDGGGIIDYCLIDRNQTKGVGLTDGYGGGACIDHNGYVVHSVFTRNVARLGGGVALWQDRTEYPQCEQTSDPYYHDALESVITGALIAKNVAITEGGGMLMRGGTANHITMTDNYCLGNVVSIAGVKYGRSGGLYVDIGASIYNSVIWGNSTYANNDVQFACHTSSTSDLGDIKPELYFTAVASLDYADWAGTTRKGVFGLESSNRRPASGSKSSSYYPEFSSRDDTSTDFSINNYIKNWVPDNFSDLISKGVSMRDYDNVPAVAVKKAVVATDLNGRYYSPLTIVGSFIAHDLKIETAENLDLHNHTSVEALDGKTTGIRTLFVDPNFNRSMYDATGNTELISSRGDCWDNPLIYLCDALEYAKNNPKDKFQILVKEGTSIIGNRQVNLDMDNASAGASMTRLRDLTASIPSNVQIYGSFYGDLKGLNIKVNGSIARSPVDYPSVLSANVTRLDYDDNIAHVITIDGAQDIIIDGFKINSGNTTPATLPWGNWAPESQHGAGIWINNSSNITLRNILIAHCYADGGAGAAIYAKDVIGLGIENLILHNNSSIPSSNRAVTDAEVLAKPSVIMIDGGSASIDHALIRGNIGAIGVANKATLNIKNSAIHGNNDGSAGRYFDAISAANDNIAIYAADGCTVTSEYNMIGSGVETVYSPIYSLGYDSSNTYTSADAYPCEYPIFANPMNSIGVTLVNELPTDGDITVYGGSADYTPRNMSPLVNGANDSMADQDALGYDFSLNNKRNHGGAADIGALENTDLEPWGTVIYVRDYGNTTDPGGDGFSWAGAINGNYTASDFTNANAHKGYTHAFSGYDIEPYSNSTVLTGLQWAVDQAYYLSLKKTKGAIDYANVQVKANTTFNVSASTVDQDATVKVWVAKGEYLRRDGFFMRNSVDVLGGFPSIGNPGEDEREPKQYETIIETLNEEDYQTVYAYYHDGTGSLGSSTELWEVYINNIGKKYSTLSGSINNVLDGDTGTSITFSWSGTSTNSNSYSTYYIAFDLGEEMAIEKLNLAFSSSTTSTQGDSNPKYHSNLTIYGSTIATGYNNLTTGGSGFSTTNWTRLGSSSSFTSSNSIDLTSGTYRYIALVFSRPNNYTSRTGRQNNYTYTYNISISEISLSSQDGQVFPLSKDSFQGSNLAVNSVAMANDTDCVGDYYYELNNYAQAYYTQRVLTQPFPYYQFTAKETKDLELANGAVPGLSFDRETVWDGFTIRHGIVNINHGKDGGAGVALRYNGVLENCVIEKNYNFGYNYRRGGGIFLNDGIIKNSIIRNNILSSSSDTPSKGCYGGGVYMRTGSVYNTCIVGNRVERLDVTGMHNSYVTSGSAVYFEMGNFYNNTIYNNYGHGPISTGGWFASDDELRIYNSIIYDNDKPTNTVDIYLRKIGSGSTTVSLYNNICKNLSYLYNTGATNIKYGTIIDNQAVASTSDLLDSKEYNSDGSKNSTYLHLVDSSAAINSATEYIVDANGDRIILPDYDADYTDRVKDCALDIGAYEYDGTKAISPASGSGDDAGKAIFYVSETGYGLRTADSPENAACWSKLQKVLDAAGRYKANNQDAEVVVRLAEFDGTEKDKNGEAIPAGYRPNRQVEYGEDGKSKLKENPRNYSILVPKGVVLEGGWNDANAIYKDEDGNETTIAAQFSKRSITQFPTVLQGEFTNKAANQQVQAYHVVQFTDVVYNADGNPYSSDEGLTEGCYDADTYTPKVIKYLDSTVGRAVVDGVFIRNGNADGNASTVTGLTSIEKIDAYWPDNYGGAAIVPSYAHIRNCIIEKNSATAGGGGLLLKPQALVSGCIIRNNSTDNDGGGIFVLEPSDGFTLGNDVDEPSSETLPIYGPTAKYANVFTSTIVGNTASSEGGGVYFQNNLRMNSSVVWRNTSNNYSNVAGTFIPNNAEKPWEYPMQYCAVENMRVSGYNNISVATAYNDGVRWATSEYDAWNNPNDYSNVTLNLIFDNSILSQDKFYYGLRKYSMLTRTGMSMDDYNTARTAEGWFTTLEEKDIKDVSRTANTDNAYIEIGARAFGGLAKETVDFDNLMTRLYVVMPEDTHDITPDLMEQYGDAMYKQMGSSAAYPMQTLTEALEYIRDARIQAKNFPGGTYTLKNGTTITTDDIANTRFEIYVSRGTYYPMRTVTGSYSNTRGNTFLVPEGVAIYGGLKPDKYYTPIDHDEIAEGEFNSFLGQYGTKETTVIESTDGNYSITLLTKKETASILADRPIYDVNNNSIIEGWGLEQQTVLSGDVVNDETSKNVFHVITVMADENYVGALANKVSEDDTEYNAKYNAWVAGTPAETGATIILDGLQITEGYALEYDPAIMSTSTYYKGGAICVDGNWATGEKHRCLDWYQQQTTKDLNTFDQAKRMVGWRNIPLIIRNCYIFNNQACMGGAVFTNGELMTFSSQFAQNRAQMFTDEQVNDDNSDEAHKHTYYGRGGAINASYRAFFVNTIFANNTARGPQDGAEDGYLQEATITLDNGSTSTLKLPTGTGGAIVMGEHGHLRMLNCDVVRNEAHGYPAIFLFSPNKGYRRLDEDDLIEKNPHQIVNTIFWGNEMINKDLKDVEEVDKTNHFDWVMNPYKVNESEGAITPESLWFCAYEDGRWLPFVNPTDENLDFRTAKYFFEGNNNVQSGTYHFVPLIMNKNFGSQDVKAHTYNFNIKLSENNSDPDGPNFINPSLEPGAGGFQEAADWMMGHINNLVDQGWTFMNQKVTSATTVDFGRYDDGVFTKAKAEDYSKMDQYGQGIYYELANLMYENSDKNIDNVRSMPVLDQHYMYYAQTKDSEGNRDAMLRVSTDPNPTHGQSYIDIGVYEYQHIQLTASSVNGVDIIWVAESENQANGTADGSTYRRATSDLQRAIETLLSSRNDHHKEIRLLGGQFIPVYTLSNNMAFTINTGYVSDANAILPPTSDNKPLNTDAGYGVKSFTIRGGYNINRDCQYLDDESTLYMAERQGTTEGLLQHLFVVEDATQRYTLDNAHEGTNGGYAIPITLENITFSNVMAYAHEDPEQTGFTGGSAIFYKPQGTYTIDPIDGSYSYKDYLDYARTYYEDESGNMTWVYEPKLTIKNCKFLHNGKANETTVPAVTIGQGGGQALIYNSLFAKNSGKSLVAYGTTCVNNTFALNGGGIELKNYKIKIDDSRSFDSELYNSILWKNGDTELIVAADVPYAYNAIYNHSEQNKANDYNDFLGEVNNDVMFGPNFTDPDNDDFSVQPSVRITGQGNWAKYVKKTGLGFGLDQNENTVAQDVSDYFDNKGLILAEDLLNPDLIAADGSLVARNDSTYLKVRDLALNIRLNDGTIERGAYENSTLMARVLYVNPNKTMAGVGTTWSNAYNRSQLQTAIDAAAVYSSSNARQSSYVIVKGNDSENMGNVTLYDGVHVYGGLPADFLEEAIEYDDRTSDNEWTDDDISKYLTKIRNKEERAIVGPTNPMSHISSLKASTSGTAITSLIDGFDITPAESQSEALTESPVYVSVDDVTDEDLTTESKVVIKNCVIHDFTMDDDVPVVSLVKGALLYDCLVRDNVTGSNAPVSIGDNSQVLNCTVVNPNSEGKTISGDNASGNVFNTIEFSGSVNESASMLSTPFAPYLQDRDEFYLGDFKDKFSLYTGNKNLWYQLHEASTDLRGGDLNAEKEGILERFREPLDLTVKTGGVETHPHKYVDFASDRDLLGNPRTLSNITYEEENGKLVEKESPYIDKGCFQTWSASGVLFPTRATKNYGGNYYPHDGSVAYIQQGGTMVLPKYDEEDKCFTKTKPFQPTYMLVREGGSLYGQGSQVNLPYVAVQRDVTTPKLVAMPFDFKLKSANSAFSTLFKVDYDSKNWTSFTDNPLMYYDGKARSEYNYKFQEKKSGCWKGWEDSGIAHISNNVLEANHGVLYDGIEVVRFTAYGENLADYVYTENSGTMSREVILNQYDDRVSTSGGADFTHEYNMGWNLVGVPYLISDYKTKGASPYNMNVPHIVYSLEGNDYVTQESWADGAELQFSNAFFTQTAVLGETETLTFACPEYVAEAAPTTQTQAVVGLTAMGGSRAEAYSISDAVGFYIAEEDDAQLSYMWGRDGAKMCPLVEMPQVYAVASGLPLSLMGEAPTDVDIPLGVDVPESGKYELSLMAWPEDMEDGEIAPWLTDHETGATVNLLEEGYAFEADEAMENVTDRFSLRFSAMAPSMVLESKEYVVLVRDQRVVVRNLEAGDYITLYTTDGKLIMADIAHEEEWRSASLMPNTIYIVRINHFAKKVKV